MRLIDGDALIANKFKNDISYKAFVNLVKRQPTIETDLSGYSDRLWKVAYERGKAEAERKKGQWRKVSADRYISTASYMYKCSECGETFVGAWSYCPNCGADMRTEEAE